MRAPTTNPITQTKHGTYNAVDYDNEPDPVFYAPEDGKVTYYGYDTRCGNNLQVTSGNRRHGFCHLEKSYVKVGDLVKKGQKLGVMGYTGYTEPDNVPQGAHLHWVINVGGSTYVYPPSLINEEDDMYKGHDAKYWYDKYVARTTAANKYHRIAVARGALLAKIKALFGIK